jgi:hypothetical protein
MVVFVEKLTVQDPATLAGELKCLGGSMCDDFNLALANQTINTLWLKPLDEAEQKNQCQTVVQAMVGIGPTDELEGMLAAQLLACHNASMECYRRAMLGEQSFEGRRENLAQANKLSRTYATLLEALNRHRGKGQQKVTVEHVHVHSGGQAVVGLVGTLGGGDHAKPEVQPHAKHIANAPQPTLPSADTTQEPVPVAGDAERSMPNARRKIARRSKG